MNVINTAARIGTSMDSMVDAGLLRSLDGSPEKL
jgi:hypothetical protein